MKSNPYGSATLNSGRIAGHRRRDEHQRADQRGRHEAERRAVAQPGAEVQQRQKERAAIGVNTASNRSVSLVVTARCSLVRERGCRKSKQAFYPRHARSANARCLIFEERRRRAERSRPRLQAVFASRFSAVGRVAVAAVARDPVPAARLRQVLLQALAVLVGHRQPVRGRRAALAGRLAVERERLRVVLLDAGPVAVAVAHVAEAAVVPLRGGLAVPLQRLGVVARDRLALVILATEFVLRVRVARLRTPAQLRKLRSLGRFHVRSSLLNSDHRNPTSRIGSLSSCERER